MVGVFAASAADDSRGDLLVRGLKCCHHIIIWQSLIVHSDIVFIEVERIFFLFDMDVLIRVHYIYVGGEA